MRELIGYGLAALLAFAAIGLVYVFYSDTQRDSDTVNLYQELMVITSQLKKTYAHTPSRFTASAISDETLIDLNIAPASTHRTATSISNVFGGDIDITGNTNTASIDTDEIPASVCVNLLTRFIVNAGILSVGVASSMAGLDAATALDVPLDTSDAHTACSSDTNAIRVLVQ